MPPAFEVLLLNTTIPQIQAAQAGDTYVCPRDIQITANLDVTGNTILGNASTDTVQVNGYMAVGGAVNSGIAVRIGSSALGGATQRGAYADVTFTSASTTRGAAFESNPSTAVASFTVADVMGFSAQNVATLGAGSTITNQHGVYVNDQTRGTNNFGVTSLVSSGSNKWNIYASGTAQNYFAGNVGIGTTTPEYRLQVSGTTGQTFSIERVASSIGSSTALGTIAGTGEIPTLTADGASIQFLGAGTWSSTSAPGRIVFNTTPAATTTPVERFQLAAGEAVFNDPGNDYDFRVESDTNTHALFVQGSDGNVGIGTTLSEGNISSFIGKETIRTTNAGTHNALSFAWEHLSVTTGIEQRISWAFGDDASLDSYTQSAYIAAGKQGTYQVGASRNSYLSFATQNAGTLDERMRLDSSGNVGIGTSSPSSLLHLQVTTNAASGPTLKFDLNDTGTSIDTSQSLGTIQFVGNDAQGSGVRADIIAVTEGTSGQTGLSFGTMPAGTTPATAAIERLRITSAGDVGIGVASPGVKLDIKQSGTNWYDGVRIVRSTNDNQRLALGNTSGASWIGSIDAAGGTNNELLLGQSTDGTTFIERVRVSSTEAIFNDPGNDYDFRVESDTNTHALFVDAGNSRVGINNSAPTNALTVSDSVSTPVAFARTSNTVGQATYIALQANNASNNAVTYASAGSVIDVNTAGAHSGSFTINTTLSAAITERVRVKSTGQVRFVPLAADPAGAEAGDVYYNSGTNKLRLYDGTSWVDLN